MKTWIVKKGRFRFSPLNVKMVSCSTDFMFKSFIFSKETLVEPGSSQINKLFGWSLDPLNSNSIRVGWKPLHGKIQLWSYFHKDGNIYQEGNKLLLTVDAERPVNISIKKNKDSVMFNISQGDLSTIELIMYNKTCKSFGWEMNPYYGGSIPAPVDMSIQEL